MTGILDKGKLRVGNPNKLLKRGLARFTEGKAQRSEKIINQIKLMVKKGAIIVGSLVVATLVIGIALATTKDLRQQNVLAEKNTENVSANPIEATQAEKLNKNSGQDIDFERGVRIIPADEINTRCWKIDGMKEAFFKRQPNGIVEKYTGSDGRDYYFFIPGSRVEEKAEIIQRFEAGLAEEVKSRQTPEQQKKAIEKIKEVFGERDVKYRSANEYIDDKGFLYLVEDGRIVLRQISDVETIRESNPSIVTSDGRFKGVMTTAEKKEKALELLRKIDGNAKVASVEKTMGEKELYDGITVFYWKAGQDLSQVKINELRDYDILISVEGATGMIIQYQNFTEQTI